MGTGGEKREKPSPEQRDGLFKSKGYTLKSKATINKGAGSFVTLFALIFVRTFKFK
jgi:hypothetical protein